MEASFCAEALVRMVEVSHSQTRGAGRRAELVALQSQQVGGHSQTEVAEVAWHRAGEGQALAEAGPAPGT